MRPTLWLVLVISLTGCRTTSARRQRPPRPPPPPPSAEICEQKLPLKVHFFDVAQALAVLVELPGGETVLVDVGESPSRPGCGTICREAHEHLVARLTELLRGEPVSLVWITHQHSDHLGGAEGLFQHIKARFLVDNGRDGDVKQVERLHTAVTNTGAQYRPVKPTRPGLPMKFSGPVTITPVVPSDWPGSCSSNKNDCSIGLRIDYCQSSILFTGDAEEEAEEAYTLLPATLLQAGHHGSDTSSTADFIEKVQPKYVVISSGKRDEGTNKGYCHPRASAVERLSAALGPATSATLLAFDAAVSCKQATSDNWKAIPVSDRLFSTARDGDVTLVTTGDGVFVRETTTNWVAP
jgi:competence protein ComEC